MDRLGGLYTNNWVTFVRSEPWESTWRCHWCHREYDHFHQAGYERLDTWAQMRDHEWNGWHWHLKPMHRSTHHCTQPNTLRTSSAGMNMRFKTEAEDLSSQKYQICKGNQPVVQHSYSSHAWKYGNFQLPAPHQVHQKSAQYHEWTALTRENH